MFGSVSAYSVFAWTRSVGGEVARELGLFLITLIALVSLLTHGNLIRTDAAAAAARTFGPFGGEFLERMIGAVRGAMNGTMMVSSGKARL